MNRTSVGSAQDVRSTHSVVPTLTGTPPSPAASPILSPALRLSCVTCCVFPCSQCAQHALRVGLEDHIGAKVMRVVCACDDDDDCSSPCTHFLACIFTLFRISSCLLTSPLPSFLSSCLVLPPQAVPLGASDLYPVPAAGVRLAYRPHVFTGDQQAGCTDGSPASPSCVTIAASTTDIVIPATGTRCCTSTHTISLFVLSRARRHTCLCSMPCFLQNLLYCLRFVQERTKPRSRSLLCRNPSAAARSSWGEIVVSSLCVQMHPVPLLAMTLCVRTAPLASCCVLD